eukprot:gene17840-22557_t
MNHEALANSARLLEEIGIGPLWMRRSVASEVAVVATDLVVAETHVADVAAPIAAIAPIPSRLSAPTVSPRQPVADDGLPSWLNEMDDADTLSSGFMPYDDEDDEPGIRINPAIATMDWSKLKETVAACEQCGLCRGRKKTAFGVGDEKAKWLFI